MGIREAIRALAALGLVLGSSACTPKPLVAGAENVRTVNAAPGGCRRLGAVEGSQGGRVTGDMTPRRDLDRGARNDLRNEAHALGADTVQIVRRTGAAHETFAGTDEPDAVKYQGVAWRCSR